MIILSHRGYWKTPEEKNTAIAFQRSFDLGFGTETDIRDDRGELVISHDPPKGGEMTLKEFLDILGERDLPLAFNIKADGLAKAIRNIMMERSLSRWFVFDMSIPDSLHQLAQRNPVYMRVSEYEPQPALFDQCVGIWLDSFQSHWWSTQLIQQWTEQGKTVCIVSPELHGRPLNPVWEILEEVTWASPDRVMLCTDLPELAAARLTARISSVQ
jgi:hypothetical protein